MLLSGNCLETYVKPRERLFSTKLLFSYRRTSLQLVAQPVKGSKMSSLAESILCINSISISNGKLGCLPPLFK